MGFRHDGVYGTSCLQPLRIRAPRASRFAEANERLRISLRQLAEERRRWAYRRLHILLEREGWEVNSKRVYRIYVEVKPSIFNSP